MVVDLGLVFGRAEVVEGAVEPLAVVEHFDELEDRSAHLGSGGPGLAVDQFLLEGREPRLADRVVPALTLTRQALDPLVGGQQLTEVDRGVLPCSGSRGRGNTALSNQY